jgi:hypothetical protein
MYHPAVALYNPSLKSTLMKDIKKLKDFVSNGFELEEVGTSSSFNKEKQGIVDDILDL